MFKEMIAVIVIALIIGAFLFWRDIGSDVAPAGISFDDPQAENRFEPDRTDDKRADEIRPALPSGSSTVPNLGEPIDEFIDPLALGEASVSGRSFNTEPVSIGPFIDPLEDSVTVFAGTPTAIGTFSDPLGFVKEDSENRIEVGEFVDPDAVQGIDLDDTERVSVGTFIDPQN